MIMVKLDNSRMRNDGNIDLQQPFLKKETTSLDRICSIAFQLNKYSDVGQINECSTFKASDGSFCCSKAFTIHRNRSLYYNKPVTLSWSPQKGFEAILKTDGRNLKLMLPQNLSKEVQKIASMCQFFEYVADAFVKINEWGNGKLGLEICQRIRGGVGGKRKNEESDPNPAPKKYQSINNNNNNNNNNIVNNNNNSVIINSNSVNINNNSVNDEAVNSLKNEPDAFFLNSVYQRLQVQENGVLRYKLPNNHKATAETAILLIEKLLKEYPLLKPVFETDQETLEDSIMVKNKILLCINQNRVHMRKMSSDERCVLEEEAIKNFITTIRDASNKCLEHLNLEPPKTQTKKHEENATMIFRDRSNLEPPKTQTKKHEENATMIFRDRSNLEPPKTQIIKIEEKVSSDNKPLIKGWVKTLEAGLETVGSFFTPKKLMRLKKPSKKSEKLQKHKAKKS